jgi:hypothetical protein
MLRLVLVQALDSREKSVLLTLGMRTESPRTCQCLASAAHVCYLSATPTHYKRRDLGILAPTLQRIIGDWCEMPDFEKIVHS